MSFAIDLNKKKRRSFAAMDVLESSGDSLGIDPTIRLSYEQARAVVVELWEMLPSEYRPVPR